MAKDVDLSSKQWRDLIFEGKNKDYGAYVMRKNSDGRHNKAMLVVVIIAALAFGATFLVTAIVNSIANAPVDDVEQEMVTMTTDVMEEPEDDTPQAVEEKKPEVIPEEVLNTVKNTELTIKADNEVKEEIKSQDELKEDNRAVGVTDFDKGTDDLNVVKEHKEEVVVEKKEEPKPEPDKVFDVVEQMPVFPGGEAALLKYVSEHIRYPAVAQENNIQGRVVVKFVVTKTGAVGKAMVVRSKDPDLDKEALRVVKSLPKFTPGKMNGHAVDVWYTLPITFKLQGV